MKSFAIFVVVVGWMCSSGVNEGVASSVIEKFK